MLSFIFYPVFFVLSFLKTKLFGKARVLSSVCSKRLLFISNLILIKILCSALPVYSSQLREIADLYIESMGNNTYEAQIKANKTGMYRALLMVADKNGIRPDEIGKIPYQQLKEAFTISSIKNEVRNDGFYAATVNYQYNLQTINKALLKYGSDSVNERFYEYLILPILKQRKVVNIWGNDQEWHKKWETARNMLEYSKIFYPKSSKELAIKVSSQNVFNLSYADFTDIFPAILFKNVMLNVCELFTDSRSGETVINIKLLLINWDEVRNIKEQQYPIKDIKEIPYIIDTVITSTIEEYGRYNFASLDLDLEEGKGNAEGVEEKTSSADKPKTLLLNLYAINEGELQIVEDKLKKVEQIQSFTITHEHGRKYKVSIINNGSEFDLAEGLYINGLTFKKYGQIYHLIDLKRGI